MRITSFAAVLSTAGLVACVSQPTDEGNTHAQAFLEATTARAECTFAADGLPNELRCTGLYSDWESRTIDPTIDGFTPGFELWSDGAKKTRYIQLPPGTRIDATNVDSWIFPVDTKVWKEFRLPIDGSLRLVETRLLHKVAANRWVFATYVWTPAQDAATRVTNGVFPFPGTKSYEVPAERTCRRCHANKPDFVLGFEAVLMAAPEARGLTYDRLIAEGRITTNTTLSPSSTLQIPGTKVERDAIGRLHANCGVSCHNADGPAPFSMHLDIVQGATPTSIDATSVFQEAIGVPSFFTPPNEGGTFYRIRPTDADRSTIFYRMSHRDDGTQMPPVATHRPDPESLASVRAWIESMTGPPYPPPR